MGFQTLKKKIEVTKDSIQSYDFELTDNENQLNEVVVSGTLKAVKRLESAVRLRFIRLFSSRKTQHQVFTMRFKM